MRPTCGNPAKLRNAPLPALVAAHVPQHSSMKSSSLIGRGATTVGLLAALTTAAQRPIVVIAVAVGLLMLLAFLGVVLPAVWSTKPARRKAATTVLDQILAALDRLRH